MIEFQSGPGLSLTVRARLRASLLVLAGGESRRMRRPKAALPIGQTTFLQWILDRLGAAFEETIVCGSVSGVPPTFRVVADNHPGAGPLAGIEAGLGAMTRDVAFAVACDMPLVSVALARHILASSAGYDAVAVRLGGVSEPTCAAYQRSALTRLTAYLDGGGRRAAEGLALLRTRYLDEAEFAGAGFGLQELANINTPSDYEALGASFRA